MAYQRPRTGVYKRLAGRKATYLRPQEGGRCCCASDCDCDHATVELVLSGVTVCGYCSSYTSHADLNDYSFEISSAPNGTLTLQRCYGVCAYAWQERDGIPDAGAATFYDSTNCNESGDLYVCSGYNRALVWEVAAGFYLCLLVLVITDKGGAPARMGVPDYIVQAISQVTYTSCTEDSTVESNTYTSSGDCGTYLAVEPLDPWIGDGACQFNSVAMVGGWGGTLQVRQ